MAVDLRQTHFRFGIEELLEATHGWHAAEDVNASLLEGTTFLLRFTEQESGATAAANTDAQFQYNRNGLGWNNITTTSAVARAVASVAFANGDACTKRLSGTGTFEASGAGCTEDGSSGGAANDIAASGNSETECAIQIIATDVVPGDTIQFRFTSPDWAVTYTVTPTLTVSSGNVAVTPGVASLATSSFAPTILTPIMVTPGTASLVTATFAPTINIAAGGITVTPGMASLSSTIYAPAVVLGMVVVPSTSSLATSSYSPSIEIDIVVVPPQAVLSLTTFAPSPAVGTVIAPSTASLSTTPLAPSILVGTAVTPGTASIATARFAPSVEIDVAAAPPTQALTLAAFTPSIILGTVVTPGVLTLTTGTFAPTVAITENTILDVGAAVLTVGTLVPTILIGTAVTPSTMSLSMVSLAPSIELAVLITPSTLALVLVAFAPSRPTGESFAETLSAKLGKAEADIAVLRAKRTIAL